MPYDPANAAQFLDQILAEADLSPEQGDVLKTITANKVAKKLNELAVQRPDYSSSLDQQRSKYDSERELWTKEKQEYRTWYEAQKAKVAEIEARAASGGGAQDDREPAGGGAPRLNNGQFVSRADIDRLKAEWQADVDRKLDKRFETQGEAVLGVTEDYISLVADYQHRFQKRLPVEEVRKKAIEEGTNLRIAYDRYIQPELEAQRKTEFETKLKEAREDGATEALSREVNPAHPGAIDGHPVFGKRDLPPDYSKMTPEQREQASQAAFEKHWNETEGFTKPS